MKGIGLSRQVVVSLVVMALAAAMGFGQEVHDDFNDGVIDPAWSVRFNNASGWTATESGTNLTVTDIAATVISHNGMALVKSEAVLYQPVSLSGDFQSSMTFSWDSTEAGFEQRQALQKIFLRLMGPSGQEVAYCGYSDPWIHYSGSKFWGFGDTPSYGGQGSLDYSGSATVSINRTGSDIEILWDGEPLGGGVNATPVSEVQAYFLYYPFDGGGGPSFFGTESVDAIHVTPEPATLSLLAMGALAMVRRRRHH